MSPPAPAGYSGTPLPQQLGIVREVILPTGWVDNKVCAIDAPWSGLRFALRRELR